MKKVKIRYTIDYEKVIEGPEEIIDTMVNQFLDEIEPYEVISVTDIAS